MISCGDKYIKKSNGKEAVVLTSEPENEYLILCDIYKEKKFIERKYIHIESLKRFWYDLKEGLQTKMF